MSMRRLLACLILTGVVVAPANHASARGCGAKAVKQQIREFVAAYNEGDLQRLDVLFLKGDAFRSYDVHPLERPDGSDRSSLLGYFEERHSYRDEISELQRLRAARYDNGNRGFGFSLEFRRSSEELSPFATGHFIVKGSATCRGIYFWNMSWNAP